MLQGIEEDVREWIGEGARHITLDEFEDFLAFATALVTVERRAAREQNREPSSTSELLERLSRSRTARRVLSHHEERGHALSVAV